MPEGPARIRPSMGVLCAIRHQLVASRLSPRSVGVRSLGEGRVRRLAMRSEENPRQTHEPWPLEANDTPRLRPVPFASTRQCGPSGIAGSDASCSTRARRNVRCRTKLSHASRAAAHDPSHDGAPRAAMYTSGTVERGIAETFSHTRVGPVPSRECPAPVTLLAGRSEATPNRGRTADQYVGHAPNKGVRLT